MPRTAPPSRPELASDLRETQQQTQFAQAALKGVLVPKDLGHAKQVAKHLQGFYQRPIGHCQHVTAQLLGHRDWDTLEQSVATGTRSDLFDDELLELGDHPLVLLRVAQQRDLMLVELAQIQSDESPEIRRLCAMVCDELLSECTPSSREAPTTIEPYDCGLNSTPQAWMAELTQRLALWWGKNAPAQAQARHQWLSDQTWNKARGSSVIQVFSLWVYMCRGMEEHVPKALREGVCAVLAQQYAIICLLRSGQLAPNHPDQPMGRDGHGMSPLSQPLQAEFWAFAEEILSCFTEIDVQVSGMADGADAMVQLLGRDPLNKVEGHPPNTACLPAAG